MYRMNHHVAVFSLLIFFLVLSCGRPSPQSQAIPSEQSTCDQAMGMSLASVTWDDFILDIEGSSTLPAGSRLQISLLDQAGVCVATGETTVRPGPFRAFLEADLSDGTAWGEHKVEVIFSPSLQKQEVRILAGPSGEHLSGPNCLEMPAGERILVCSGRLSLTPSSSFSMPEANSYATDSPERALTALLYCWRKKDWKRMAVYTALSWRSRLDEPGDYLEGQFCGLDLLTGEILERTDLSESQSVFNLRCDYLCKGVRFQRSVTVLMLLEEGIWGVSPEFVEKIL
ncbi:MAG: hypothetical protein PHQ23_03055 [Candidatus Wallbacteria bacterium]|nr:hypothetical protein [Candidatus Wallbacteria bacterium]